MKGSAWDLAHPFNANICNGRKARAMSSATRGGWLWYLHKVKRPSAPIVAIEFHHRLGSGARAREKVEDARILSTCNGNEVLNQPLK